MSAKENIRRIRVGGLLKRFAQGLRYLFHWKRLLVVTAVLFLSFLLLNWAFPLPRQKVFSQVILAEDGSMVTAFLTPDEKWRLRTRTTEVPQELLDALIEKEDRWFWVHPGVNPLAIARAGFSNLFSGKRVSGASTITMQVARMMEPKSRTWGNKLVEAFRALQLEWSYSKTEILEMYLSYLPMGGNVEGVKAASYLYFDQPPQNLSLGQSVLLTVIPNRPNSLRPDRHPEKAKDFRDKWLRYFQDEELFAVGQISDALHEPLLPERHEIPNVAPQFAYRSMDVGNSEFIATTIDIGLQRKCQSLLKRHVKQHRNLGLHNGAVLVVDNHTMEVKAYCASADFHDTQAEGQCDAIRAHRSPGSTLKPLIYAMALDQGKIHPKSMLLDIPTHYADFSPVNYDMQYRGQVRMDQALQSSLNIPAVRTLQAVGYREVVYLLQRIGFSALHGNPERYGLSLALGGCEASLEELVTLYAAFAHEGRLQPIRILKDFAHTGSSHYAAKSGDEEHLHHSRHANHSQKTQQGSSIISPEAAWIITDILSGMDRPDLPRHLLERTDLPKVAWKTGTSFGRRDAWAIGYNPDYTIGVWMGNMDGSQVLGMSGGTVSVPLLIDVFTELNRSNPNPENKWFTQPSGIETRKYCSLTGHAPGNSCTHATEGLAIEHTTKRIPCQHQQEIYVNADSTIQYCKGCAPIQGFQKAYYPAFPAELSNWYIQEGIPYLQPPVHNPNCRAVFSGRGPKLADFKEGEVTFLEEGQRIQLRTTPSPDVNQVYWYVDGKFSGVSQQDVPFSLEPPRGRVSITCMDDKGRLDHRTIEIQDFEVGLSDLSQSGMGAAYSP